MRFENGTLSVTFQYERGFQAKAQKIIRTNTCTIREVEAGKQTEDGKLIVKAHATQAASDPDNKFLARKYALKRAMDNTFDRERRTRIWKEYLAKVGKP